MFTYYLKFDDEETMYDKLYEFVPDHEEIIALPRYNSVDVIGVMQKTTTTTEEDGTQVDHVEVIPGFFANVKHNQQCQELEQYRVFPQTPERIWA